MSYDNEKLRAERPLFLIQKFITLLDGFSHKVFKNINISCEDKYLTLNYKQDTQAQTEWLIDFVYKSEYFSLHKFTKDKEVYTYPTASLTGIQSFQSYSTYEITLVVECNFLE